MLEQSAEKRSSVAPTKIGECAAQQPLSGVSFVGDSRAVNGMSHGGYIQVKSTQTTKS